LAITIVLKLLNRKKKDIALNKKVLSVRVRVGLRLKLVFMGW
jgi:hypothetical protein